MRAIFLVFIAIVVVSALVVFRGRLFSQTKSRLANNDIYEGLRNQALHASRTEIGLTKPSDSKEPWGVLMDWPVAHGTATVVAFSDGNASIYLSSGGGYIGGSQSHPEIRDAAKQALHIAKGFMTEVHLAKNYPLPQSNELTFWFMTDSGVYTTAASEEDLKTSRIPISKLANAMQQIITQYRLISNGK